MQSNFLNSTNLFKVLYPHTALPARYRRILLHTIASRDHPSGAGYRTLAKSDGVLGENNLNVMRARRYYAPLPKLSRQNIDPLKNLSTE